MFLIYSDDTLVGRSALENGDPPMGVAFGDFVPGAAFASLREKLDEALKGQEVRVFSGLSVRMSDGGAIKCTSVAVLEAGEFEDPSGWEVHCIGFQSPPYADLFPHHADGG